MVESVFGIVPFPQRAPHLGPQPTKKLSLPITISLTTNPLDITDNSSYTFAAADIGLPDATRDVLVTVYGVGVSGRTLSSVTINGSAANIDVSAASTTVTNSVISAIARLRVSSGTTADIGITFSASIVRCGIGVYRMVNGSGAPTNTALVNTSTADFISTTLTIPAYGVGIGECGAATGASTSPVGAMTWTILSEDFDRTIETTNSRQTAAHATFTTSQVGVTVTTSMTVGRNVSLALAAYGPE